MSNKRTVLIRNFARINWGDFVATISLAVITILFTGCKTGRELIGRDQPLLHDSGTRINRELNETNYEALPEVARAAVDSARGLVTNSINKQIDENKESLKVLGDLQVLKTNVANSLMGMNVASRRSPKVVMDLFNKYAIEVAASKPADQSVKAATNRLAQIATNAATVATDAVTQLGGVVRLADGTNDVSAYLQIAADEDVDNEFGRNFRRCFFVGEVVIENKNLTNSLLAYSSSLEVSINYFLAIADWPKDTTDMIKRITDLNRNAGANEEQLKDKPEYIIGSRRPSTYADILAIFEYQRKANLRQRVMDAIKSLGEVAAGASVFVGGPVYPKAVAFATGVMTPEIEKNLLWDVLLHAKNLEARSLKEIEEVPAGGSIHRVVFFPKRGVPGVIPSKLVYINAFNPSTRVELRGAFISKSAPATTKK